MTKQAITLTIEQAIAKAQEILNLTHFVKVLSYAGQFTGKWPRGYHDASSFGGGDYIAYFAYSKAQDKGMFWITGLGMFHTEPNNVAEHEAWLERLPADHPDKAISREERMKQVEDWMKQYEAYIASVE